MNTFWFIILCGAVVWAVIGSMYYLNLTQQVRFRLQRFVLILVSGPLVWMFKLLDIGLDSLDIFFVRPLNKFERWLTKN
jgi:hypothetical protein